MADGTNGTRVDAELIRKGRSAPGCRRGEWARAAVGAANGLEAAGYLAIISVRPLIPSSLQP